jgi:hypothetical protein
MTDLTGGLTDLGAEVARRETDRGTTPGFALVLSEHAVATLNQMIRDADVARVVVRGYHGVGRWLP